LRVAVQPFTVAARVITADVIVEVSARKGMDKRTRKNPEAAASGFHSSDVANAC